MPADTSGRMAWGEFEAPTGRTEHADPEETALGEGLVGGFGSGHIAPFPDEGSAAAFDRLLARFGPQDLPRTPVEGLGDGAFALFVDPEDEN